MTDDQKAPENEVAQLLWEAAGALDPDAYPELVVELEEAAAASLEAQEPVAFQLIDKPDVIETVRRDYHDGDEWEHLYRHPPTSSVPEGWQLVPVRPTDEMLQAVTGVHPGMRYANRDNAESWDTAYDTYVSMLAAAPQQGGGEDE